MRLSTICASTLLVLGMACGFGDSIQVDLVPVGGASVSGTATLQAGFCKSPCVTSNFDLSGGTRTRGAVRMGSCADPGEQLGGNLSTDPTFEEPVSMVSSLDELSGKACVQVVEQASDGSEVVVACGDVP